jgi:hypothetical protein
MATPISPKNATEILLAIIAGTKNKQDRLGLSYLADKQRVDFSDSLHATIRLCGGSIDGVYAEVAFFLGVRLFWASVPSQLFDSIMPNFEDYARESLRILGMPDTSTRNLAVIFRRLRSAARSGRIATRLNLETKLHEDLFEKQGRRCALCNYKFSSSYDLYQYEDEDEYYVCDHNSLNGELVLKKYFRRPVLDHIIPYFLGGDSPENWQILCQTCNLGKGESLSWLTRRGWSPATKINDLLELSCGLRYAVIADFRSKSQDLPFDRELRIFKKDNTRLVFYDNLECRSEP